jgi:GTPase
VHCVAMFSSIILQHSYLCTECCTDKLSEADLELAILTTRRLSETLNAECVELRRRRDHNGFIADFLIRVRAEERDFTEVRLLFIFAF